MRVRVRVRGEGSSTLILILALTLGGGLEAIVGQIHSKYGHNSIPAKATVVLLLLLLTAYHWRPP